MKPIKELETRAFRTYRGGMLIDRFLGKENAQDTFQPEDWISSLTRSIPVIGEYDVVVVGAGVAGLAAAVAARREGLSVLVLEKNCELGGLATLGQINYFVPMCNGHGKQIIKGMCDEFIDLSVKYGYNMPPKEWQDGEPGYDTPVRYPHSQNSQDFKRNHHGPFCGSGRAFRRRFLPVR